MFVSSFEVNNFRNLRQITLECSPSLNLILGQNASGKTSLLEALYFLGRARSFRTRQINQLIHTDENDFRIVAKMTDAAIADSVIIGIQRSVREIVARIGGTPVRSLAQLAAQVPVLLLNADSHRLLEGGPQQRRRFMDWGLFHTEEVFIRAWKRYSIALRNRNAALRLKSSPRNVDAWDEELNRAAIKLAELRADYCSTLQELLVPLVNTFMGNMTLTMGYRRGWSEGEDLVALLHGTRDNDRHYGYTRLGPHRADFVIKLNGWPAAARLSRGQQKLLIVALILAQANFYKLRRNSPCILLIDDLPSELDRTHRDRIMTCLADIDIQLFITAIESGLLDVASWKSSRIFHIEQGNISQVA